MSNDTVEEETLGHPPSLSGKNGRFQPCTRTSASIPVTLVEFLASGPSTVSKKHPIHSCELMFLTPLLMDAKQPWFSASTASAIESFKQVSFTVDADSTFQLQLPSFESGLHMPSSSVENHFP